MDAMTVGNQKWHGARPSLFIAPRMMGIILSSGERWGLNNIKAPKRIRAEPSAWAMKYLTAPSVSWRDLDVIIKGINLNKLSSSPNHSKSQCEAEIDRRVLRISVEIKSGVAGAKAVIKIWAELNGSKHD